MSLKRISYVIVELPMFRSLIYNKEKAYMTLEEEMVLFAVLQDIADELRKIKSEQQNSQKRKNQKHTEQSKARSFSAINYRESDTLYTEQEH